MNCYLKFQRKRVNPNVFKKKIEKKKKRLGGSILPSKSGLTTVNILELYINLALQATNLTITVETLCLLVFIYFAPPTPFQCLQCNTLQNFCRALRPLMLCIFQLADEDECSPLYYAVLNENKNLVEYLLQVVSKINARCVLIGRNVWSTRSLGLIWRHFTYLFAVSNCSVVISYQPNWGLEQTQRFSEISLRMKCCSSFRMNFRRLQFNFQGENRSLKSFTEPREILTDISHQQEQLTFPNVCSNRNFLFTCVKKPQSSYISSNFVCITLGQHCTCRNRKA